MAMFDALRAHWGDVAVLLLLAGAGFAAMTPGRGAPIAVVMLAGLAALAAFGLQTWQTLDFGGPSLQARSGMSGAIIALAVIAAGAVESGRGERGRAALIGLAGAGFAIAATYANGGWSWIGLWLGGLAAIGLIRFDAAAATRPSQLAAMWGLACALGLLGAGLKMTGALQTGGIRLEIIGASLELIGLIGAIGLAPFNLLQMRVSAQGGASAILLSVAGPCVALALTAGALAGLDPALAAGPLAWLVGACLICAAVLAVAASDLRGAIAALLAGQAGSVMAAFAVAAGAGNRAAAEAAGIGVIALALAGLAALTALDALAPDQRAGAETIRGRGLRAPAAALALIAALISLMGAPLSLAFLGRWLTMGAALETGWALGAAALVAVALAAVIVTARWIVLLFARSETSGPASPLIVTCVAVLAALIGIGLGLAADWPLALADLAFATVGNGGGR
jgi:hypothetical protein